MLSRRKLLMGAAAAALIPAAAPAMAGNDALLADILYGVTDTVLRDYIRRRYRDGHWDGTYWHIDGRRYSPRAYRRYWESEYRARPASKHVWRDPYSDHRPAVQAPASRPNGQHSGTHRPTPSQQNHRPADGHRPPQGR